MNVALQSKTDVPKTGRVDYDYGEVWCVMCGRRRKPEETVLDRNRKVCCRRCGRSVRANPHNKKKD